MQTFLLRARDGFADVLRQFTSAGTGYAAATAPSSLREWKTVAPRSLFRVHWPALLLPHRFRNRMFELHVYTLEYGVRLPDGANPVGLALMVWTLEDAGLAVEGMSKTI